jgi:hypothetical protein
LSEFIGLDFDYKCKELIIKNENMKIITTIITCAFCAIAAGQPATWTWAKSGTGNSNLSDRGKSVATDVNGNVYSAGIFESPTIVFGTHTITSSNVATQSGPTDDGFLVKYDASGNVLWVISVSGPGIEEAYAVDTDSTGNVYLGGLSSSTLLTIGTMTVAKSDPLNNFFIAKIDPSGNTLWIRNGISDSNNGVRGVAADKNGNVVIAGYAQGSSLTIGSQTITNQAGSIVFTAKYDTNGNALWAQQSHSYDSYFGFAESVDIDPALGDIYVTGHYDNITLTFGTFTLTNTRMTQSSTTPYGNEKDAFILKYLANGTLVWAKTLGGTEDEQGMSVSVWPSKDPNYYNADVYVGGHFGSATLVADTKTLTNSSTYLGQKDMFVLKLDPNTGNTIWATRMGGGGIDLLTEVAAVRNVGVVLHGTFASSVVSSGTFVINTAPGNSSDIIVAGFNSSGQAIMAKTAGGTDIEESAGLAVDKSSLNVYVNGYYSSNPTYFDNIQLSSNTSSNWEVFTAQLSIPEFSKLLSVGIAANTMSGWIIAPNPVTDELAFSSDKNPGDVTVSVYNMLGQTVVHHTFENSENIVLNLSSVSQGVYTVVITAQGEIMTKKIIKQ